MVKPGNAEVDICKKVMSPKGRALETLRVHAGDTVRFRIRVTNLGTDVASNVRVCDLLPRGLTLVRSTVKVDVPQRPPVRDDPAAHRPTRGLRDDARRAHRQRPDHEYRRGRPAGMAAGARILRRSPSSRPVPRAGV